MEDSFDFAPPTSVLAPAIMAVAAVNVIIVAYVVKAFRCFPWNMDSAVHTHIFQGRECKREEQDWLNGENFSEKTMKLWFLRSLVLVGVL